MNYYPFHLGDYAAHTAHLEPMEDLAYRRLLDLYYRTEKPLPYDWRDVARLTRMKDYPQAIEAVLSEFFVLTDEGWRHARCDAEIARMQDKQAKAKASAQASVNARSANAQRTLNERSAEVELPTPTPTPTPEEGKTARKRAAPSRPDGVDESVWTDWLALRKAKRAPVTGTVVAGAESEAQKAGMTLEAFLRVWCARGSQGLQADWIKPHERQAGASQSFRQRDAEAASARVAEFAPGVAARPQQTAEVIDVTARRLG